jgi:Na+-transporting methylmalonyl-CoA/oxaloacetate decarboxylase gamma subunit
VLFCSPFVEISPGLATGTQEIGDVLGGGAADGLTMISSSLLVDAGRYTVIVHARWQSGSFIYDMAIGRLSVRAVPRLNLSLLIMAGVLVVALWSGLLIYLTRSKKQSQAAPELSADETDEAVAQNYAQQRSAGVRIAYAALTLASYLGLGSVCFMSLEPAWSATDAVYFCMVTCSTVGYGDLSPRLAAANLFASPSLFASPRLSLTSPHLTPSPRLSLRLSLTSQQR